MRVINISFLALIFTACSPIYVNYDYERTTNFQEYKTYNYYADMDTGLSELDTNRLLDALDAAMAAKGFRLAENPDFFIDIKSNDYQAAQRNGVGLGVGGIGRNLGAGISIGLPIGAPTTTRQITIDFVDENKKQLFWQAVSESSFNPKATPENREVRLQAIVDKVLKRYPPKK